MASAFQPQLKTMDNVLTALRNYDEHDEAIHRLIEAIEDDRAALVASSPEKAPAPARQRIDRSTFDRKILRNAVDRPVGTGRRRSTR